MTKLFAALLTASMLVAPAFAWDNPVKQVKETNVLVNDNCSGTFIDHNLILTANHCVADQYKTVEREKIGNDGVVTKEKVRIAVPGTVSQLTFDDGTETQRTVYAFKLIDTDNTTDLALLRLNSKLPNHAFSMIACKQPDQLETVWAVGNPFAVLYSSITKGMVTGAPRSYASLHINGDEGNPTDDGHHNLIQHSAGIAPGNSGGAMYNDTGELAGVNVRGGAGISLAVPLADIKKFLMKNGYTRLWDGRCKGE